MKGTTLTAASYDISFALISTFSGAHIDSDCKDHIKFHEDTAAVDFARNTANVEAKEQENRLKLRGNENIATKYHRGVSYHAHIHARGHTPSDMIEDDVFKDYINQFYISTAFIFGRSVPAKTTTKGTVVLQILSKV